MSNTDKINAYLLLPLLLFVLMFAFNKRVGAETKLPPEDKINVFVAFSENIEKAAMDAATVLNEEEQLESFPLQGYQLHCTLYMTQYPAGLQEQIEEKIAEFAKTARAFSVTTTGLAITDGDWFFVNIERNRNLQTLADYVVELLAPLRAQSDYVPEWAKNNPAKVDFIKKYGSPNVYSEFNPHLTLLPKSDGEKLQRFLSKHQQSEFAKPVTGQVIAIGLGLADRNGQMKEPMKIFPLQAAAEDSEAPADTETQVIIGTDEN